METEKWWHSDNDDLTTQLSPGILNELQQRILHTNIQREKLQLNESSERIRQLFQREIQRYNKRMDAVQKKKKDLERINLYKTIARQLMHCNHSLAKKCRKNNIEIEKFVVHGTASCYR
jgi:hypothetical protein